MLFKISTNILFAVILHSTKKGKGFKHYKSFQNGVQREIDSKRVQLCSCIPSIQLKQNSLMLAQFSFPHTFFDPTSASDQFLTLNNMKKSLKLFTRLPQTLQQVNNAVVNRNYILAVFQISLNSGFACLSFKISNYKHLLPKFLHQHMPSKSHQYTLVACPEVCL